MSAKDSIDPKIFLNAAKAEIRQLAPKTDDDRFTLFAHIVSLLRNASGLSGEGLNHMGSVMDYIPTEIPITHLLSANKVLFKVTMDLIKFNEVLVAPNTKRLHAAIMKRQGDREKLVVPKGVRDSNAAAERIITGESKTMVS